MKQAIINKFKERETYSYLEKIDKQIQDIQNSKDLKEIWENYKNKFSYAENINYEDIMLVINIIKDTTK